MTHTFDEHYWNEHWQEAEAGIGGPPHPYLAREVEDLAPGTAIEAGCGTGAEAVWLASRGWQVTGADISARALGLAAARAAESGVSNRVHWVRADLSTWEPGATYHLVSTHYAHAAIPQLALYDRLASWVAPGGTLLIVGHGADGHHPAVASATAADIAARLDPEEWQIATVEEPGHDVVVRATRAHR